VPDKYQKHTKNTAVKSKLWIAATDTIYSTGHNHP